MNPIIYAAFITIMPLLAVPAFIASAAPGNTKKIKVFLVAVGDNGKRGKRIGCEDSLVAVTRSIKPTSAVLRAAIDELLKAPATTHANTNLQLGNYWLGENLRVKRVSLRQGVSTIEITGEGPRVAGICDVPRITEQIEATARQFASVKKVRVFINGQPLADAIS